MQPDLLAAVDLGSNSFHMIVARRVGAELQIIDRLREPVRLGAGFDDHGRLERDAIGRALACLERFGQRLRAADPNVVRAVGTQTLRKARNSAGFLDRAQAALGHDIEVISGREEARLVYLGVAHAVADAGGRRLVIDIGGASTECILGEGFEPQLADSLSMGCVGWSERFFPDGAIERSRMREARLRAAQKLEPIARPYRSLGWSAAFGCSGTIRAIDAVLRANGLLTAQPGPGVGTAHRQGITAESLRRLRRMLNGQNTTRLALPGLDPERAAVLPGGVAILSAALDALGIERIQPAPAALREGLLWDLLGRIDHEDVRDRTIRRLRERFVVDVEHASRVETIALDLLAQVAGSLGLQGEWPRTLLSWAAQLHEVGLAVAFAGHHRHGAYLVEHSDMPGFSRDDQRTLAAMIRCHRRKYDPEIFALITSEESRRVAKELTRLLRIAVRLCRARSPEPLPPLRIRASSRGRLELVFPTGWLELHPMTAADLATEHERVHRADLELRFR